MDPFEMLKRREFQIGAIAGTIMAFAIAFGGLRLALPLAVPLLAIALVASGAVRLRFPGDDD